MVRLGREEPSFIASDEETLPAPPPAPPQVYVHDAMGMLTSVMQGQQQQFALLEQIAQQQQRLDQATRQQEEQHQIFMADMVKQQQQFLTTMANLATEGSARQHEGRGKSPVSFPETRTATKAPKGAGSSTYRPSTSPAQPSPLVPPVQFGPQDFHPFERVLAPGATSVCFHCQQLGHIARQCPVRVKPPPPQRPPTAWRCFLCQKPRHRARTCPTVTTSPQPQRSPAALVCFYCQRLGHVARRCPIRNQPPPLQRQLYSEPVMQPHLPLIDNQP